MALPVVKTLADCADLDKTVWPFVDQFYDLTGHVLQNVDDFEALKEIYLATNPLVSGFYLSLVFSVIFLVASEVTGNYSQVDRFWSILPTIHNAQYVLYAHMAGMATGRMDLMLAASTVWSCRLTFNYWRRGGYQIGSEDYRWEIVRQSIRGPLWFVFNVLFISLFQNILLFSITLPSYALLLSSQLEDVPNAMDLIFSGVMVAFVAITAIADQQQWNYQNVKHEYQRTAKVPAAGYQQEDLDRGFYTGGLFKYSRHPNYAAEQGVWITLYCWAGQITETPCNWTIIGPVLYISLFQASTIFSEGVSAKKYPEYKEYQKKVRMFVPGPTFNWATAESKAPTTNGKSKAKKQ